AINSTNPNSFSINNTLISNNSVGISVQSQATSNGVLSGVALANNASGMTATGTSSSVQANVTVQNAMITNNITVGLASNGYSLISVSDSVIANNGIGLEAQNSGGSLQLSRSFVVQNATGWTTANGGQAYSFAAGNAISGNTAGNTAIAAFNPN